MIARYHVQMTTEALQAHFDPAGLQRIIRANLAQDRVINQFTPAIHFDSNAFAEGEALIRAERALAVRQMQAGHRPEALAAFGRLLHTRQDFYAHSNWVALWVAQQGGLANCQPEAVPICLDPRREPALRSGRGSVLWFLACRMPLLGRWALANAPADTHEAMNLDHPGRGPLFPLALAAATRHTTQEFGLLLAEIGPAGGPALAQAFLGRGPGS